MSDWGVVFLGVIAAATFITALVQVAVIVVAGRLAKRLERVADDVHRDLKPVLEHLNAVGRDAARASSLAAAQVERADQVFADLASHLDRTLTTLQTAASRGAREGGALVAAVRAAVSVIRDLRTSRSRPVAEDEDALFI